MAHMNDRKYNASLSYGSLSLVLGMGAAITTAMMTGIFPLILAPLAIMFGIFSKGAEKKLSGSGKHGLTVATAALAADLVIIGFYMHSLATNADAHATLNRMSMTMYGISFDDTMESLEDQLGFSIPGFATEEELRGGTSGSGAEDAASPSENSSEEVQEFSPEDSGITEDAVPYSGYSYT